MKGIGCGSEETPSYLPAEMTNPLNLSIRLDGLDFGIDRRLFKGASIRKVIDNRDLSNGFACLGAARPASKPGDESTDSSLHVHDATQP